VSKLGNPKSVWAKAQYRETKESYEEIKIDPSKLQFHLDTKNVILDLEKLKKKKIIFDTRFGFRKSCGYEDMDLGMQIHKLGMTGLLVPSVEVGHPEPTNVIRIFKKYFNRGAISVEGEIKWKYEQKFRNFSELFFNTRLVARDVLTPDNDKKFFWCCLFIDWFYYLGYKWEKLRRRFLVY
jgi:hypothetical protein